MASASSRATKKPRARQIPEVNLNTAWYSNVLGEIGDACAWQDLADIALNAASYAVQPLWSNKIGACALHTP